MGPLGRRSFRRWSAALLVAGLLTAGGVACRGSGGPEITDSDRTFPLPAETDFVVRLVEGASRVEVRKLTTDLIVSDGVEATEAHYDAGEIRVVVSRDMSTENRQRLRARLLESPEVADVDVEVPED